MIKLGKFKARVGEHSLLASTFQYVHLELVEPARITFQAGQYLMMKIPGEEKLRQYSIASAPAMNHAVDVLVDISPGGDGSVYMASLSPGDEVEFMAPAGRFVVAEEPELVMVATGSGISPVRSMILDLLVDKRDTRPMWLHWGLRYEKDVFWFDEFARLAEEYDNFTFDLVLSRAGDEWRLCRGHTTDCVLKHKRDFTKMGVYLCGNRQMIEELSAKLADKGVAKERIYREKFF